MYKFLAIELLKLQGIEEPTNGDVRRFIKAMRLKKVPPLLALILVNNLPMMRLFASKLMGKRVRINKNFLRNFEVPYENSLETDDL
jgi:hypothetical protein